MDQKIAQHRLSQIRMFESLLSDLSQPLAEPGWGGAIEKLQSIAQKASELESPGAFDFINDLDYFRAFLTRRSFTNGGKVSTLSIIDRQRIIDVLGVSRINNGSNSLLRLQEAVSAAKILSERPEMRALLESIKNDIMRDANLQSDDGETAEDASNIDRPRA